MSPTHGGGGRAAASSRRRRTLLHTAPIHALEDNKGRWDGDWRPYDLRRLQVAAIEETLDRQGVEGGVGRQSLTDTVAAVASRMATDRPHREHLDVAERVLAHLLNDEPESDFVYEYTDDAWERRSHTIRILDQRQTEDGSLVVRASIEAINLLIGALDLDIADAQKAEERLLDEYIRAGRLDAAQTAAEIARLRSIQYQTHIADYLRVVRQDVGRIDWSGRVLDEIRAAGRHLEERSAEEARMRQALHEHYERTADPERRQALLDVAALPAAGLPLRGVPTTSCSKRSATSLLYSSSDSACSTKNRPASASLASSRASRPGSELRTYAGGGTSTRARMTSTSPAASPTACTGYRFRRASVEPTVPRRSTWPGWMTRKRTNVLVAPAGFAATATIPSGCPRSGSHEGRIAAGLRDVRSSGACR